MKKNFAKKVSISVMSAAMAATMMPAAAFAATDTSAADAKTPAPIVKTDASSQAQDAQKSDSTAAQETQKTDASKTSKDSKTTKTSKTTKKTVKKSKKDAKKTAKKTKKIAKKKTGKKTVKSAKVQAPVNFKAERLSTDTAKLSWDAVKGADSYIVYSLERGLHLRKVAQVKDTSCTVKIPENFEKSYAVKAVKGNKKSGRSTILTVYMKGNLAPAAAKSLTMKKSGKATLTWDKVKDATVYYVYSRDEDGASHFKGIAYGGKTSITVNHVKEGKSYEFNIVAYGKFGRTPDNFVKVTAQKAASKDSADNKSGQKTDSSKASKTTKSKKTTKTKKDAKNSKTAKAGKTKSDAAKTKADSSKTAKTGSQAETSQSAAK